MVKYQFGLLFEVDFLVAFLLRGLMACTFEANSPSSTRTSWQQAFAEDWISRIDYFWGDIKSHFLFANINYPC